MAMMLHNQIEMLKARILSLGALVEKHVHFAVEALVSCDSMLADQIIRDDDEINLMEVDLEEECLKILVLYQPVAIDLRYIVATLKINSELERVGDLAVNVAQRAKFLSAHARIEIPFDISEIGEKAQTMLKNSLDALVNLDAGLARQVLDADDEVDQLKADIHSSVVNAINQNSDRLECLIQILLAARHLERIADKATDIAEDVIYMAEGRIVRHNR